MADGLVQGCPGRAPPFLHSRRITLGCCAGLFCLLSLAPFPEGRAERLYYCTMSFPAAERVSLALEPKLTNPLPGFFH
jgi:hypothetical protein